MALTFSSKMSENLLKSITNGASTNGVLYLMPTSVSFPVVGESSFPTAGNIFSATSLTYAVNSSTGIFSITTPISKTATSAGTVGWFAFKNSTGGSYFASDSVGLSGSGSILTLNTMSFTTGQTVTATLSMKLLGI